MASNKQPRWWVSGATGSWGQELVKQLCAAEQEVVAYCHSESRAAALKAAYSQVSLYIGDIRDAKRVQHSLVGCTHAVHAAAMKRVDAGVSSPEEMAAVNIGGTSTVIEACIAAGVPRCFYISTDKACYPTTTYGATKFVAERLWVSAADILPGFVAARFGNALDSTGSVLWVWRAQHALGLPLSVRPQAQQWTRFVMTIPWAVGQVLGALGFRQGVYQLDPVQEGGRLLLVPPLHATRLDLLVQAFAGRTVRTQVTGPVPGEKQHEQLWTGGASSMREARLSVVDVRALFDSAQIDYPAKQLEPFRAAVFNTAATSLDDPRKGGAV